MGEYGIAQAWSRTLLLSLLCMGLLGCGPVVRTQASTAEPAPEPAVVNTQSPVEARKPVKTAPVPPRVVKPKVTRPIIQLAATVTTHDRAGLRLAVKAAEPTKKTEPVIRTFRQNGNRLLRCVREAVDNYPYSGARVALLFTIGAAGNRANVDVVSDTTSRKRLGSCLQNHIKKFRFRRAELEGARYKISFKVPSLQLSNVKPSGGLFLRQKGRNLEARVAVNYYCDPRPRFRRLRRGKTITYVMRPAGRRISRCTQIHEKRFVEKNVKRGRYTVRVVKDGKTAFEDTIDIK